MRFPATCLLLVALMGCERSSDDLRLATPVFPVDREIAGDLADLFDEYSLLNISLTPDELTEEAALAALVDGSADLALVSNNMPFDEDVATVLPLYPTVLHIAHLSDQDPEDGEQLIQGSSVFAGPEGSASRLMFERLVARLDLEEGSFDYVDATTELPDVIVVFAPISPDRLSDFPQYRLFGLGPPEKIGSGSIVDAAALMDPRLRPFVVPVGTYGDATPEPVVTLAVDRILVARRDLDKSVVYDLVTEVLRLRPALAARKPGLFSDLSDDFDTGRSTFVVHPGAQAWLQRDAPSVYERYSGIAEVAVTLFIALFSATLGGMRLYKMKRKNRIDSFYSETIALKNSIDATTNAEERLKLINDVRKLQNSAFEMLVDEKLAADESFRIFITLSNDVLRQLGATDGASHFSDN